MAAGCLTTFPSLDCQTVSWPCVLLSDVPSVAQVACSERDLILEVVLGVCLLN